MLHLFRCLSVPQPLVASLLTFDRISTPNPLLPSRIIVAIRDVPHSKGIARNFSSMQAGTGPCKYEFNL
jgi:hypothetical protein